MKHNRMILISEHAIDRFIERFEFAGKNSSSDADLRIAAERTIQEIWAAASYISDDPEGVLFRNRDFQCDFIVKDKMIKTLFQTKSQSAQPGNESSTDLALAGNNSSRYRR